MEKQRMLKMSQLEQDMLVKALCDTQSDVQPEQAEEMRSLAAKTVRAPRRRLYLSDEEFGRAVQALNRSATPICRQDGAASGLTAFSSSC